MTYIATVNWETFVENVILDATDHYYHCNLPTKDENNPGAGDLQLGYYLVDYLGYIYEITAFTYYTTTQFTGSGLDDATISGTYSGSSELDYKIEIDATGTPDTFQWSDDGGSTWDATGVSITGAAQTLNNGVTVTFGATTGHTLGDSWEFTASPWRVKVYDINEGEQYEGASFKAPYQDQLAFVYKANSGGTIGLSQSQLRRLSHPARDTINEIDNNIVWEHKTTISGSPLDDEIAVFDGAGGIEGDPNFIWDGSKLGVTGNINLEADNNKLYLGTSQDTSMYYNGTDLIIDPKEVGSGELDVLSSINLETGSVYKINSTQITTTDLLNVAATATEVNYLDGFVPTNTQMVYGDGSKLTSASNLIWDNSNETLTFGNSGIILSANGQGYLKLNNELSGSNPGVGFKYDSDDYIWISNGSDYINIGHVGSGPGTSGALTIDTDNDYIGINTIGPSYELDIDGTVNISSSNTYKINSSNVLSATILGSGVITSSLTTVGTIGTGVWNGTVIDHERGGLEADVSAYNGLVKISGGTTSSVTDSSTNWDIAYTHSQDNSQAHSDYLTNNAVDDMQFINDTVWSFETGSTNTQGLMIENQSSVADTGSHLKLRAKTFDCAIVAVGTATNTGTLDFYVDTGTKAISIGDSTTSGLVTFNTAPQVGANIIYHAGNYTAIDHDQLTNYDIAEHFTQANITTVGTIGTGTWQGTTIGEAYGGTGQTTYTTGDVLYASAANTLSKLAVGTNGHVLTLAAGIPSWAAASGGVSFGSDNEIPHMNSGGTDFDYDSDFTWDTTRLLIKKGTNDNIFIGASSGNASVSGIYNVGLGREALTSITSGGYNIGIGKEALNLVAGGDYNIGIGYRPLDALTSGSHNIAIGDDALTTLTTSSNNIAIGYLSGWLSSAANNVFIGVGCFGTSSATATNNNVSIGYESGNGATGSGNIFLGYQAGSSTATSDKLYIENSNSSSPLIYGEFDNDIVKINGQLQAVTTTTYADACLLLDQNDGDEPFINFDGATSGVNQNYCLCTINGDGTVEGPKNYSSSAGWAFEGMIRINVNGTDYWSPYYSADTS